MEQKKETAVSTRIPDDWLDAIDARAAALTLQLGPRFNRTDIIRMAIAQYLGLSQPATEQHSAAGG